MPSLQREKKDEYRKIQKSWGRGTLSINYATSGKIQLWTHNKQCPPAQDKEADHYTEKSCI